MAPEVLIPNLLGLFFFGSDFDQKEERLGIFGYAAMR